MFEEEENSKPFGFRDWSFDVVSDFDIRVSDLFRISIFVLRVLIEVSDLFRPSIFEFRI